VKIVGKLKWDHHSLTALKGVAGTTGLEPAASAVTEYPTPLALMRSHEHRLQFPPVFIRVKPDALPFAVTTDHSYYLQPMSRRVHLFVGNFVGTISLGFQPPLLLCSLGMNSPWQGQ
jgi:hypothetical protein